MLTSFTLSANVLDRVARGYITPTILSRRRVGVDMGITRYSLKLRYIIM